MNGHHRAWTHLSGIEQNGIELNPSCMTVPETGTVRQYKNVFIRKQKQTLYGIRDK